MPVRILTNNSQLNLGQLIAALEKLDPATVVAQGFDKPHSYRGFYGELAFEPATNVTVGSMLAAARSAVGATYEGWKGGDYTMTERTPVWLAREGSSGHEIVDVVEED